MAKLFVGIQCSKDLGSVLFVIFMRVAKAQLDSFVTTSSSRVYGLNHPEGGTLSHQQFRPKYKNSGFLPEKLATVGDTE